MCDEDCTALDVNLGVDVGRLTLDGFDVELGRCRKSIYLHVHVGGCQRHLYVG